MTTPEHRAPEGGRPVSEMQRRIAEEIMNTERELTGCYARRFDDLKPESRAHYLWLSLAAMKAMREPTEECRRSSELGAKVRRVAAQLSSERFNGWANPLVADLVDAADFLEGKTPIQHSSDAVLSLDAEISIAEGGKDGD